MKNIVVTIKGLDERLKEWLVNNGCDYADEYDIVSDGVSGHSGSYSMVVRGKSFVNEANRVDIHKQQHKNQKDVENSFEQVYIYLKENNVRDLDIALEMFTEAEIKQEASKGKIFLQGNRIIL